MEPIWKAHGPPGLDGATIRLPEEPLPVILKANARRTPDKAALVFYGREVSFGELDEAREPVGRRGAGSAAGSGPGASAPATASRCSSRTAPSSRSRRP